MYPPWVLPNLPPLIYYLDSILIVYSHHCTIARKIRRLWPVKRVVWNDWTVYTDILRGFLRGRMSCVLTFKTCNLNMFMKVEWCSIVNCNDNFTMLWNYKLRSKFLVFLYLNYRDVQGDWHTSDYSSAIYHYFDVVGTSELEFGRRVDSYSGCPSGAPVLITISFVNFSLVVTPI